MRDDGGTTLWNKAHCFLDEQNYADLGGKHFNIAGQQEFSLAAQCDTHQK